MGPTEWTVIGAAIGLLLALASFIKFSNTSMQNQLNASIAEVRAEIAALRTELKLDIQANRNEITTNRRLLARFALHRHGDDGLPLAPLTDTLDPPEGGSTSNGESDGA